MIKDEALSLTAPNQIPASGATDFVVVGFYTPNYMPLAQKFEANLGKLGIPSLLYPVPASAWKSAIILKPQMVGRAMQDFPGKTVVLMDIDCELFAPIDPILSFNGDVSLSVGVKFRRHRADVNFSSRVVVWRPTNAARRLRENWEQLCREQNPEAPEKDDETLLMQAIIQTSGASIHIIDPRYAGRDPKDAPPDAVIIHHSAHNATRASTEIMPYLKQVRRKIIGRLVGKSYVEWKYRAAPISSSRETADQPPEHSPRGH